MYFLLRQPVINRSKEQATLQEAYDKLQKETSGLADKIRDMVQENKDCEVALQNKVEFILQYCTDIISCL